MAAKVGRKPKTLNFSGAFQFFLCFHNFSGFREPENWQTRNGNPPWTACQFADESAPGIRGNTAPGAQVAAPEAADIVFQPSGPPVALAHDLIVFEFLHQPVRQTLGVGDMIIGGDGDLLDAAFLQQETLETVERVLAGIDPEDAGALGFHIRQGGLQVIGEDQFGVRPQKQPQDMPRCGKIQAMGHILAGAAPQQPALIPGQQFPVFGRPLSGGARLGSSASSVIRW